jgi:hypothetical protein
MLETRFSTFGTPFAFHSGVRAARHLAGRSRVDYDPELRSGNGLTPLEQVFWSNGDGRYSPPPHS